MKHPKCEMCQDSGFVCEDHLDRPWDSGTDKDCGCGAAGQLCECKTKLYDNALQAIFDLHADTSINSEEIIDRLNELIKEINILIDALEAGL